MKIPEAPKRVSEPSAPENPGIFSPTTPLTLNLPKGGGALHSIDEKFTVNAANGSCQFSIPLQASKTRSGLDLPALTTSHAYQEGLYSGSNVPFTFDDTQPWMLKIHEAAGTWDNLSPDEIKQCFLMVKYTLQ